MKTYLILIALCTHILTAKEPLVIAHRGASFDAPENTMPSFQLAWKQGADGIEGDFHLTADGNIVCIHDYDTERVAGVKHVIAKTTLAELQQLDVGKWKQEKWKGTVIPTLDQVLACVPTGKCIYIEVKCGAEIVPSLLRSIKKCGLTREQIFIISFDQKVIERVKQDAPEFVANWLHGFEKNPILTPSTISVKQTLQLIKASGFGAKADSRVGQEYVNEIKQHGFGFHVWTVDDPAEARRFYQLGVDSITTNRPLIIKAALVKEVAP